MQKNIDREFFPAFYNVKIEWIYLLHKTMNIDIWKPNVSIFLMWMWRVYIHPLKALIQGISYTRAYT